VGGPDSATGGAARPGLTALPDLRQKIVRLIEANGPLSIADYMAICLYDPDGGYYMKREPFGVAGDFTTAPEVSQMFGELIAVWLYSTWRSLGAPSPLALVEIGPGRGTMMKDMLRVLARIDPDFVDKARLALVETSPRLREVQRATLGSDAAPIEWHESIATLPREPLLIVGNELFDAVPIRQYVKAEGGWRERAVGLDGSSDLAFVAAAGTLDPALLPPDAASAEDGAIAEAAPARAALMDAIAERIATDRGAGLFIDYGYLQPALGDTLQALSGHAYADPLAEPGKADLTAHVDFFSLAQAAKAHGLDTHLATQAEFLLGTGLIERAGSLGAKADPGTRERLREEAERLAGPDGMGTLFKVLAVGPRGMRLPPFVTSD
jgi:SAM-dependent MidA family methyltransferase